MCGSCIHDFAMRKTPTKGPKRFTRLVQFTLDNAAYRRMCVSARRADMSQAALIREALKTHFAVEDEIAAKIAADKAEAERRIIERSRAQSPDSFADTRGALDALDALDAGKAA
jgi:hypothetical protein